MSESSERAVVARRRRIIPVALPILLAACSQTPSTDSATDAATPPPPDAGPVDAPVPPPSPPKRVSTPVPPVFIGTGGFGYATGSAFAGAAAPRGMAKVGPDTKGPWGTINFLHCAGYWYGDDIIQGFSHLHLHGTGAADYGVLTWMPTDAITPASTRVGGYESKFDKSTETGAPGMYGVTLARGNIRVAITATAHAAHHRWTYPAGATSGHVVVDLDHHLSGGTVRDAEVTLDPSKQRLRGRLRSLGQMSRGFGGYDVFFEARTRKPWTNSVVWTDGGPAKGGVAVKGSGVGFALDFDLASSAPAPAPLEVQVGISLVSPENAAANLAAELPDWDFDRTRSETATTWERAMSVVQVRGGSDADRAQLTAALYHSFLMPTVLDDVDGRYRAHDGSAKTTAAGFHYVSDMSLWDTYRTLHPFWSLVAPDYARDAVRSLHEMAKARGSFPRWPIATGEAGTMIGASAEVVLADAYLKGVRDFDAEAAYSIMRAAALDPVAPPKGRGGRGDLDAYMKYGYVPASAKGGGGSVSRTIEYAQDDYALSQLASALGHRDDAAALLDRSKGWRKLFDPATGYLFAKHEDGSWADDHSDPTAFSGAFVEANAEQTVWGAPHDLEGLLTLFGGRAKLVAKLEKFFEDAKTDWDDLDLKDTLAAAAPRPHYWGGNEPDIHAPYLFAQAGRPDLTQRWVKWATRELYGPGADGLPGNDDSGTMSAWYIFSALGFYPLAGSDRYTLGAPLFPHAEIAVAGGTFTVDAPEVSPVNIYVQSVKLDGVPLEKPELRHKDIHGGGRLEFTMGPRPSRWGRIE